MISKKLKNIKHWDKFAYFWDAAMLNYPDYHKLKNWHIRALLNKKIVLDSGAFTGNATYGLLKNGSRVYGVDISSTALKILQAKCKKYSNNLVIKKTKGSDLSWVKDKFFDGINSMVVLPYVDDAVVYLKELYRILKSNGIIALSTNDPNYKNHFDEFHKTIGKTKEIRQDDFREFFKLVNQNIHIKAKKNWFTPKQLQEILSDIGFKSISEPKYVDYKVSYFIKAKK
jgi:ubiquinone/menaquinone biosynthesis C-methylase UbiE